MVRQTRSELAVAEKANALGMISPAIPLPKVFSKREPAETSMGGRDVFNEKPTKEDQEQVSFGRVSIFDECLRKHGPTSISHHKAHRTAGKLPRKFMTENTKAPCDVC